jgi:parallel beta-helix repeat protein
LAVFSILLLVILVTIYSADENTTQNQEAAETIICDEYAAVDGSDDAKGTKGAPFNTVQRLVDSLSSGQVGCLRGGVYTDPDKQVVFNDGGNRGDRIILQSYPGETAEFRGSIYIPQGSNYVTVRNMRLDGSYGPLGKGHSRRDRNTEQAVRVLGDDVTIHNNDISNRRPNGDPDLAGTCIIVGSSKVTAASTSIKGNRIHHCGQMPRINREHGIYASSPRGAEISNNFIYDNADRGIQLYPNAKRTLIEGNVIDGNGKNLVFASSGNNVSSGNIVRNNVISNSRVGWNVSANWTRASRVGRDNEVYDNCVWASSWEPDYNQNGGISPAEHGFDAYGNLIAEPTYANRETGDFGLGSDDPCEAVLNDQSAQLPGADLPLTPPLGHAHLAAILKAGSRPIPWIGAG